jgi:uncharacterized protein
MDEILILIAVLLSFFGIAGCVVPGLPGPPLNLIALFMVQSALGSFTTISLIVWTILVVIVVVADYWIPVWTSKKFGATREGIIGSIIGMFAGMLIPPVGIILGLALGAVIGDMLAGRRVEKALHSGFGTVLGTLVTIGLKLAVSGTMSFVLIWKVAVHYF